MIFLQIGIVAVLLVLNFFFLLALAGSLLGSSFGSPFVPTQRKVLQKMIALAQIKSGERVFDLGCGDGRVVFAAEKKGAICTGIEISPPVWLIARVRRFFAGKKSEIRLGNIFKQKDLSQANVIFLFMLPAVMERFHRLIFPKLKPGTRIVSHAFSMKGLRPTKTLSRKETGHAPIFLFVK